MLSWQQCIEESRKYSGFPRSSIEGEYCSFLKQVGRTLGYTTITLPVFRDLVSKPCVFCGGKTPDYDGNMLTFTTKRHYLLKNAHVCCWPCKNVVRDSPRKALEQMRNIVKHIGNKSVDVILGG